ncbi:hypothetical protein FEP67_06376 [Burkholderia multivorans]|nr:hypothetical protein [Burkholderia multivorans]MDR8896848.1 hypothetical protein [Burkholderia multivorans]MDR8903024.1 hypothetical protein [Burkholderia multivorans]MDR8909331.1 hypothetical protein [Burkholderia multivorans]MDR8915287.1 hypothetical protein [Burkholderia multivorans]
MRLDLLHDRYLVMRCDRGGLDFAIAFDDAEDDDFTRCTPTTFAVASPAKRGFVAFQRPAKRLAQLLLLSHACTNQTIEALA